MNRIRHLFNLNIRVTWTESDTYLIFERNIFGMTLSLGDICPTIKKSWYLRIVKWTRAIAWGFQTHKISNPYKMVWSILDSIWGPTPWGRKQPLLWHITINTQPYPSTFFLYSTHDSSKIENKNIPRTVRVPNRVSVLIMIWIFTV